MCGVALAAWVAVLLTRSQFEPAAFHRQTPFTRTSVSADPSADPSSGSGRSVRKALPTATLLPG